jgi:D-3-phosphoglycerate dehydrogenase
MADLDRAGLMQSVAWANVLWVRLRNRIDAEVMAAAQDLRIIVSATTGLNHIDLTEAERRRIRVLSLRGETDFLREIRATAEHTIGLTLALLRHVTRAHRHVLEGGWDRDLFWGNELNEKTVGVVGYGRLGRIVAGYLQAFGARVLAADPDARADEIESGVTLLPLVDVLRAADGITLHVNLNAKTRGFFGAEQFALMKPGAWFINTARGELVDETALLAALRSGRLSGAAVDVLNDEHATGMRENPLVIYARANENLIITPHIGGCTTESVEKTELFLAEKLRTLLLN